MLLQTHEASIALEERQMLSLTDAKGMVLRATLGTLWITHDGDAVDHILRVGDSVVIERDGRTLVTAISGAAAVASSRADARRKRPAWSVIWRSLRPRVVPGVLLRPSPRLRPMVHE